MKVGFVGLGKLGLPVAVALDSLGHEVIGFDIDAERMKRHHGYQEAGHPLAATFDGALQKSRLKFWPLDDLVTEADVVMVAVPTPHMEEYDGTHPLPKQRANFDYTYLHRSLDAICAAAFGRERPLGVFVISTVLPGTLRYIVGTLAVPPSIHWIYNPQYIAMGTTLQDFLDPEFIMIGHVDHPEARSSRYLISRHLAHELYEPLTSRHRNQPFAHPPLLEMSCESAELAKVVYNTAISAKLAVTNVAMELCHKTPGTNIDDISRVLMAAHRRVSSPQYWKGGMGDGGACHPRDNIAMSWLARETKLGFDIFEAVMAARQWQAAWFASEIMRAVGQPRPDRPNRVLILGYAYKPNSNITTGSHALLVRRMLNVDWVKVEVYDHIVERAAPPRPLDEYDVIFLGCQHDEVSSYEFPDSATVIDPFRCVSPSKAKKLVRLGIGPAV